MAALNAAEQWTDAAAAVKVGVPLALAEAWQMPDGVLPRLRMLACGWTKPGDRFRATDDAAWWSAAYRFPLWVPLATYAASIEKANGSTGWLFDEAMSQGDSTALQPAIKVQSDELAEMQRTFADACLPFFAPSKPGEQPKPNVPCRVKLAAKRGELPDVTPGNPRKLNPFGVPDWLFWAVVLWGLSKLPSE